MDLDANHLPQYMSPTILEYYISVTTADIHPSNPLVDIYSFGMLLFEICTRRRAFQDKKFKSYPEFFEHVKQGVQPFFPPSCPKVLKSLVRKCLASDPAVRPTLQEAAARLRAIIASGFSPLVREDKSMSDTGNGKGKEKENANGHEKEKEKEKEPETEDGKFLTYSASKPRTILQVRESTSLEMLPLMTPVDSKIN